MQQDCLKSAADKLGSESH